jgi:hypothetical protein
MFAWLDSLHPLLYWLLIIGLTPFGLMLLGLLMIFLDLSLGVIEDPKNENAPGCILHLLFLGTWGGISLGIIFGVAHLLELNWGVYYPIGSIIGFILLSFSLVAIAIIWGRK